MRKVKFFILFILIFSSHQIKLSGQAKGLFMSVGTGPRLPVGTFAEKQNMGIGFDFEFSYTDNKFIPVFFYSKLGYLHFPGRQEFYRNTDYSAISSNAYIITAGIRYYLNPLITAQFLLMPVIEGGISYAFFENFHAFKNNIGRNNYIEDISKLGIHAAFGVSMFLMDVIGTYNYYDGNQYLSFDFRIRIPIASQI